MLGDGFLFLALMLAVSMMRIFYKSVLFCFCVVLILIFLFMSLDYMCFLKINNSHDVFIYLFI